MAGPRTCRRGKGGMSVFSDGSCLQESVVPKWTCELWPVSNPVDNLHPVLFLQEICVTVNSPTWGL